jgi:hypothetical protein
MDVVYHHEISMSWMDVKFDSHYVYHPNMESHIALHRVVNKVRKFFG